MKELETRISDLELEKLRFLSHSNSINKEHKEQVQILNKDIKALKDEKDKTQKRLQTTSLIDQAIIDL